MSKQGKLAYQSVRRASLIENKSPHELTLMLFDGALNQLSAASAHIDRADRDAFGRSLDKVLAITMELQGTLKDPETNEISANLYRLYAFVIEELLAANRAGEAHRLGNATQVLSTLREAWAGIAPDRSIAA